MKPTHKLFHDLCNKYAKENPKAKILDFGCGHGELVIAGMESGIDICGCEYAGPGGHLDIPKHILETGLTERIRLTDGKALPYDDASFDLVVSNQVFEHIPNFLENLSEIARVLKPGGTFVNFFPHKETLFEAHCRAPMVHWTNVMFFKRTLLAATKICGFRRRKKEKNLRKWIDFWIEWLHQNTYYLSKKHVLSNYEDAALKIERIDSSGYSAERHRKSFFRVIQYMPFKEMIAQRLFGLMIVATRT